MTHDLIIRLRGSLFLGGETSDGRQHVTLRDEEGQPFIPASALKGAIRAELERLGARRSLLDAFGGRGVAPRGRDRDGDVSSPSCSEAPGGGTARIFFGDARLVGECGPWMGRPLVSIDRETGTAVPNRLATRETLAPFGDVRFIAQVDASRLDPEDQRQLAAGISSVLALGAGRSSGLGWVAMQLAPAGPERAVPIPELPFCSTVDLLFEAIDPLCFGTSRRFKNFFPSRPYLPAKTLRGAVVTAAMRHRGIDTDQSADPAFGALILDPRTCLRFSDGWSVARDADLRPPRPRPAPATLWRCRRDASHRLFDRLLVDFFRQRLLELGITAVPDAVCLDCGGRLERARQILAGEPPRRRFATRLRMDRATGRGEDQHLFNIELLDRGTLLRARVSGLTDDGRQLLADAFAGTVRVGHGRGQGYGRLRLLSASRVSDASRSFGERSAHMDQRVRSSLERLAELVDVQPALLGADRKYFSVTLLSDLLIPPGDQALGDVLSSQLALGSDVRLEIAWLRRGEHGGWDALRHWPTDLQPTLVAGSVALLSAPRGSDLDSRLQELEERGVGLRREQGFGHVLFNDPIHLAHTPTVLPGGKSDGVGPADGL